MKIFNVLSFDPDRVKLDVTPEGSITVRKTTTPAEYRNIVRAHDHINKHPLKLKLGNMRLSLSPAPVVCWEENNSVLVTEFMHGDNLEHILRDYDHSGRRNWIVLLREFLGKLRLFGFLWGDFAPRNMIFQSSGRRIIIVDFEREQTFRDGAIKKAFFSRYVRNYSREEFSCFLVKEEQDFLFGGFLTKEVQDYVPVSEISSKRKKALLKLLLGSREAYSVEDVEESEDIMASVATPFFVENALFYPMDILDRIGSKGGAVAYARTARKIKDLEEEEKFNELTRLAKSYQ